MSSSVRFALLLLLLAGAAAAGAADKGPVPERAQRADGVPLQIGPDWISPAVQPEFIRLDARTRPVLPRWRPGDPIREIPRRYIGDPRVIDPGRAPVNAEPGGLDPLAELQRLHDGAQPDGASGFTIPTLNFEGLGNTGVAPSDVNGDVGPDHYVQAINGSGGATYLIFDKDDGSIAAGPFDMQNLGTGGNCATGGGDAVVLYDELSGRWLLTEFTGNNSADLCLYLSAGSDPVNTTWARYVFAPLAGSFPDYPKYGVWPDAYYLGTNQGSTTRPVCALERPKMLAGLAAQMKCFNVARLAGFGFQVLQPVDHDGTAAPPAGAPGVFLRHRDDEAHNSGSNDATKDFLELFELTTNWVTPASASLAGPMQVPIASFDSNLNGLSAFQAFPQPNGQLLDPLREPVMHRAAYRNFGGYETIVGNLVTDVDGADTGGVRWFELRRSGGIANPWTKFDEGTFALADGGDPIDRWMAAIAMDRSGNMALGYSVVRQTPAIHPGVRYTGRLAGDAPGVMTTGESTLVNGSASQTNERWGDYHSMSVDPEDGCTFWFTAQYTPAPGWSTRVGSMRHHDCGDPEFLIDATPLSQEVCLAGGSTPLQPIAVDIDRRQGYSNPVTLSFGAGLPAGFSGGYTVNPVVPPGSSVANISIAGGTAAGSYPITIRGSALGVDKDVGLTAVVSSISPAIPVLASPAAGAINQPYSPTLSWNAVTQALRYELQVATDAGFTNIVYSTMVVGTAHQVGIALAPNTVHHWRVRAQNACGTGNFAAARSFTTLPPPDVCPTGSAASQVFFDNMESGANGWVATPAAGSGRWRQVTTLSFSPSTSWKGNDIQSVSDQKLDSPSVAMPAAGTALTLQFQHSRDVEDNAAGTICFDGGRLEISLDGGTVYTPVPESQILTDPYDHAVASGFQNPLAGERAWCGLQAFTKVVVDLTPYRGSSAKLRFRLGTDNEVAADGWYVDDVRVQNCAAGAPAADVGITKTDGTANATAGTPVSYTIVVSNLTATAISGVAVADTFPGSLGSCSWTCSAGPGSSCAAGGNGNIANTVALAASGSVTYTAQCTLSAAASGTLSNTATATYANDPNGANNSATDVDTIVKSANLIISKSDGVAGVTAGGSTTYTILANNAGPSAVPNATVTDTFPAGLACTWTCVGAAGGSCGASGNGNISDGVALPVGGTATYTVSCNVSPTATGSISNTASIASPVGDPNGANNSATDVDTVAQSANLSISKTDGVGTVAAGGSTTYTLVAGNAGPSAVASATVADTIPPGLTCSWTCTGAGGGSCGAGGNGNISDTVALPVGGTATYTMSCTVSPGASGSIANTATISSAVSDPNGANNSATDTNTVGASANLAISKTNGVTSVTAGGSTTYTLVASNAGPSAVPAATVTDTIPAGLSCSWTCVGGNGGTCGAGGNGNIGDGANLPSGGSATYTISCNVSPTASGSISNTATIASAISDPNNSNNTATDVDTVVKSANLAISKTDGVTSVTAGAGTTYTIVASNAGPSAVASATVTDTLPAGLSCAWTCAGGAGGTCGAAGNGSISDGVALPVGGTATYTLTCNVSPTATGSITNTATIASGVPDPNGTNNTATDVDTVSLSANLGITKTDGVGNVAAGGATTYTIVASNAGPSAVASATVTDTLPASLTCSWTCTGGGGGTCGTNGNGNINDGVALPVGGSATYALVCTVSAAATASIANTATISSAATDPTPGNNSATDTDTVTPSDPEIFDDSFEDPPPG